MPYCHPLCPTFVHIIGRFPALSRGKRNLVEKKLSAGLCGNMTKITATDCGLCSLKILFVV
jgi:hypothetical protein